MRADAMHFREPIENLVARVRPPHETRSQRGIRRTARAFLAVLAVSALLPAQAQAATTLTVSSITWDVVGLDSNNVSVGPNHFPVGARVCNTGAAAASNVQATFVWDTSNAFIKLRPGTASTLPVPPATIGLAVGACTDFYFEVEVTRDAAAYNATRGYHIAFTADAPGLGDTVASTAIPREVFVERIISQSRNAVTDMQLSADGGSSYSSIAAGGSMTLVVGNTYDIKLVASTATNGYEQIETFINFPNIIFQILSVATTYTAESSPTMVPFDPGPPPRYDSLYGDGCVWEDNPLSPNYRSCNATGKAGGNITVTYRVKILSVPGSPLLNPAPLSTLVHDFSGSSYHYNADYGVSTRYANIVDPLTSLSFSKSFSPATTSVNGVSVLTFTISNLTTQAVTGVNFTDTFPTSPGAMVVASPASFGTSGCGTPTFSPTAGAGSISFSNGTLGPSGVCTVRVGVTAPVAGTYNNASNNLFVGSVDTGQFATASLTVNTGPALPSCTGTGTGVSGMELARWTMEPSQGTTAPPAFSFKSSIVSSATASFTGGTNSIDSTTYGNPLNSWLGQGWAETAGTPPVFPSATMAPYFEWVLDTSRFSGVGISFHYQLMPNGDWAAPGNNIIYVYSSTDGVNWTTEATISAGKGATWQTQATIAATSTGASTTRFRINAVGAKNATAGLRLDNIVFSGCGYPFPKVSKAFAPNPIAVNATSTLTFTLANENSVAVSGVAFTDNLPAGVQVAAGTQSNACGGTLTATVGGGSIVLSGGTIAARSATAPFAETTCVISVPVTATTAGPHDNVSGYVSSTESGTNTGPNGSASATLTAVRPPIISKAFSPETILAGGTSILTFVIENPNPSDGLSGVAFSDSYPAGVTNTNPAVTTNSCLGSVAAADGGGSVSLTGGSLVGGATCTVTVVVTSASVGAHPNTSGNVSHVINGATVNGNTAADTLYVRAVAPSLALQKQVATSASGPWSSSLVVASGGSVYYRFVVENTGDVPLTSIGVTDPLVDASGCVWPSPLPVAVAANENHIATCVVGPVTALAGNNPNTAQAQGTYSGTVYNSNFDRAVYENGNFGHLPAAYTNMNLYNDGGARHLNGTTYLGASVTTNATDGINTVTYTPKATDDGVTWTPGVPWVIGSNGGSVNVFVTCPVEPCYLNAWIDWNADNDLNDSGEKIFVDNLSVSNGLNTLTFSIPSGARLDGTTLYSRFRVSDQPMTAPLPNGQALNGTTPLVGEIEDPTFQVSNGVVTPVTVSYFRAERRGERAWFEWSTATETANVGFNLYAQDGDALVRVNPELIPSRATDSLHRLDYAFEGNATGDAFVIEDVDILGVTRRHGPFQAGEEFGERQQVEKTDQVAVLAERGAKYAARQNELRKRMGVSAVGLEASAGGQSSWLLTTTLNLKVRKTGIYRVTYEMVRNAGLDLTATSAGRIVLTNRGQAVPIYMGGQGAFGPGSFFEFYGEALDTIYTDTNIYTLQISKVGGDRIGAKGGQPGQGQEAALSYPATLVVNNQRAFANYAPGVDAWYDTSMLAYKTPKSWSFPFEVKALAGPSDSSSLELVLWGVTDWPQNPDHHVVARLNGIPVADQKFNGLVEHVVNVDVPAGALQEGTNTLQLTLPGDTGVDWDMVNLDKLSLTYMRKFQAEGGRLTFTAEGKVFQVTDLPSRNIVIYSKVGSRLMRLERPRVEATGGSYNATFAGENELATYFVSTTETLLLPELEATDLNAELDSPADYLVISHPDFIDGIQPLVQARRAEGYTVAVVDVTDLYAKYTYGIFDPEAIRRYIADAVENLGVKYVLLVGGDTYDYRNYLGRNSHSYIPSIYVTTGPTVKFVPADPLYADLDGDNLPDLPIGRFPVRSAAELSTLVGKTLAYARKDYGRTAVFASDKKDGALSFKGVSNGLSMGLPADWRVESIHLDDLTIAAARQRLLAGMNAGTAMVTFTGHSGPATWTFSGLLNTKDAAALTNAGRPFVVVQWGCWNTYHVDPVNTYLVQSFLFSGDRGAAAVLGATTLTDSGSEEMLGALLTPRLARQGVSVGQALQEAKSELAKTHPELLDVLLGWTLMGDPALVIER